MICQNCRNPMSRKKDKDKDKEKKKSICNKCGLEIEHKRGGEPLKEVRKDTFKVEVASIKHKHLIEKDRYSNNIVSVI